jgi:hypothetical protein
MNAARKAAVAIIAGLATATSVVGAASTAMAGETGVSSATASKAVGLGSTIKESSATPPKAKQVDKVKGGKIGSQGTVRAAASTSCYVYSNYRGDLCSFYLQNYGGSRGGYFYASSDMRYNYFVTSGWGYGSWTSNKAESVYNYDYYYPYRVFTNANYTGYYGPINPRTGGNYSETYRNGVESAYQY